MLWQVFAAAVFVCRKKKNIIEMFQLSHLNQCLYFIQPVQLHTTHRFLSASVFSIIASIVSDFAYHHDQKLVNLLFSCYIISLNINNNNKRQHTKTQTHNSWWKTAKWLVIGWVKMIHIDFPGRQHFSALKINEQITGHSYNLILHFNS